MTTSQRLREKKKSDRVYHIRLNLDNEKEVIDLSYRYGVPVAAVIASLVADGLDLFRAGSLCLKNDTEKTQ